MDPYAPLLDRTRVPQPSLQRLAVISIFSTFRTSPTPSLPPAISTCLLSTSPAVIDQSVRELCCLVSTSTLPLSTALLQLYSALEAAHPQFVNLFVKGIGFLIRLGFNQNFENWRECSAETHPFVKIVACRREAEGELMRQVVLVMMECEIEKVCVFLRPLLSFCVLRVGIGEDLGTSFVRSLVLEMSSVVCTLDCEDATIVLKMIIRCLKLYPQRNECVRY